MFGPTLVKTDNPNFASDISMSFDEIKESTEAIVGGHAKVLYISPERFNNEKFKQLISKVKVRLETFFMQCQRKSSRHRISCFDTIEEF